MRRALAAPLVLLTGLAAFLSYLGYFGGPVFVRVPATAPPGPAERGLAAVLLSGDMGFNVGMGPRIADRLAADGIPVIGVNSLTYFRTRRSSSEVAALVADAAEEALKFGHAREVVLIGQSFGADMLQVGVVTLPPQLRARVRLVALIVPTDSLYFRASPAELFNLGAPDGDALPTARQLTWVRSLCVHGAQETNSLCARLDLPNMRRVTLPGGHPLQRDVSAVYSVLRETIEHLPDPRAGQQGGR